MPPHVPLSVLPSGVTELGKVVCVKPGERCRARYERIYRSYGLTCRKGALRERNFIGPANP
jgi:hypothetical protein